MRRTITSVLGLAAAAAIALSACSTTSTTAASTASDGALNVTLWHSSSGAAAEAIKTLVAAFNSAHEGKINLTAAFQGSYADAQVKYTAAIQSNSTPSIMMMNDVSTQFMIDSKQTVPLSTFAAGDNTFSADSIPAPVKAYYSSANGLLSMPFNASQPILYINPDLATKAGLDPTKPPTTWKDVVGWAKQIKAATSAYGLAMSLTDSWMVEELTATAGKQFCMADNGRGASRATGIKLTDPTQLSFLTDMQQLYTSGAALNAGTGSSALNNAFSSGKVAMMMASTGVYGSIKSTTAFKVQVSDFPTVAPQDAGAGVVIGGASLWIDGPGHNDGEQKAAYEVEKFLQSAANQAAWSKATGFLSVNTGSSATAEGAALLADPAVSIMYKQLASTPASNSASGCRMGPFSQVRSAVISDVDKLLSGKGTPGALMANSEAAASKILSDYAARVK